MPAVGAVVLVLALAACSPSTPTRPDFSSQVGKTYAEAAKAVEKAGLDGADIPSVDDEMYYDGGPRASGWFVCTQSLEEPWEEGEPWAVSFELVADMDDCPGGKPRKGLDEEYQQRYDPPAPDELMILEELAPDEWYNPSTEYGDIPAVLRGPDTDADVAKALGLKESGPKVGTRLKDYCSPDTNPEKYSADRHGLVCRVGEDEYGTMVFRDDRDPGSNMWKGLYGIQAWFCCETEDEIYSEDDSGL
jgi:hypothetical protein